MTEQLLDFVGKELTVGQTVIRPVVQGMNSCYLELRTVERIKDGKIYLNGSRTAIKYPTMLIVTDAVMPVDMQ
jgi:hypothetical protein